MKLRPDITLMDLGDDTVAVPTGAAADRFRGIIRLNASAALIVRRLQEEATIAQLVDALLDEYEVDRPTAERDVEEVLATLRTAGALEEA